MSEAPQHPREERTAPKVEVVVSASTVVKALAIFFGIVIAFIAKEVVLGLVLSAILVLGLDPPVSALERRGWGRGKAVLLVFGGITVALLAILVVTVAPVVEGIGQFAREFPAYVDQLQRTAVLQDIDEHTDVLKKLKSVVADVAKQLPEAVGAVLGVAGSFVSLGLTILTLAFVTLFGLIAKPQLTHSALEVMLPPTATRVDRSLDGVSRTICFALLGNIAISIVAGTVVGVAAWVVGAPSPIVLAVVVGFFDLIPQVGAGIAAVIVFVVTLVGSGPTEAGILLLVICVYQPLENYLIQPAVMGRAVELSAFATITVVVIGAALLGVVGAILAVPVAAAVKVVVRDATAARRARMAALATTETQEEPTS